MIDKDLLTSSYDYHLPKSQIALSPAVPADSAKLLVYKREEDKTIHTTFREILEFLPKGVEIFLNDTKVIKARVFGKKSSGGKIELLLNKPLPTNSFEVLIRGRVKVESRVFFDLGLEAEVVELLDDGLRVVKFFQNQKELTFEELIPILEQIGHTPLPPYINREDTKEDSTYYQSIFAKNYGAVAAPTASLHFTPELFKKLQNSFNTHNITLHIGAGTFKPVEDEIITDFNIHSEYFEVPKSSAKILESSKEILAVGTTVTRTIENYIKTKKRAGECKLFLHPKNPPKRVNYLLTNFHLPKSTLIMLVSSFIGREKTLSLYKEAVKRGYRFFSYGDAMLIL